MGIRVSRAAVSIIQSRDYHMIRTHRFQNFSALLLLLIAVAFSLSAACSTAFAAERRPNIVFLISDDHDYDHFGFAGHTIAKTPAIDRMARGGTLFTTAHLPMSRCHPTLASMLSGRYPHQTGIYYNYGPNQLEQTNALPLLLKQAGYATYCEGKYWEGDPRRMGFTHGPGKTARMFVRNGQKQLFNFLELRGQQPFFIWWAPMLPHTPHNPPEKYLKQFEPAKFPVPDYIAPQQRKVFLKKEHKSYAMETWMDDGVDQLVAQLRKNKQLDNTLFVFLIDNGWCNGLISKGSPREKGIRTPVIFYHPGQVPAGKKYNQLISTLDVTSTILDYAGIDIPKTYAGRSLKPMIQGSADLGRDALYGATYPAFVTKSEPTPQRDIYALHVRTQKWKYIFYLQDVRQNRNGDYFRIQSINTVYLTRDRGDQELFDLHADPHELNNLAGQAKHHKKLAQFKQQVLSWWHDTGGKPLDLPE